MTALEKSTRRKIFYAMAFLFALIAPLAILYSRGYVPDFKRRGFVATGGIFVKTLQSGARVFVDAEFSKETSFISRGALITGLLPRRYAVRVEKEGYQPWSKTVRVSDEEVLEFRSVLLPPATITPRAVFSLPRVSPGRVMALGRRRALAVESGDPARPVTLAIVNPETGAASARFSGVSRWSWDGDAGALVVGRNAGGRMRWSRAAFSQGGGLTEEPLAFRGLPSGFSADRVVSHPAEAGEFYFSAGGALFLQGRSSVPVPIAEQIHSYAISRDRIYFVSKNGFFAESDLTGGDTKLLGRKGLLLDEQAPARIEVGPGGDVAVFDAASGLFLYRPGRTELELIAGGVAGVDFTPSADRMLYWDEHRLWIYWLKDNPVQPFDLAGAKKQIFYSDAPIRQAYLDADGTHAFYATATGIRMAETDDRAGVNSYDLLKAKVSSFALDPRRLTLYWLDGAKLFAAELNP